MKVRELVARLAKADPEDIVAIDTKFAVPALA